MTGPEQISAEAQGIIPRALCHIFQVIAASPHIKYIVRAAYLEIYNEQVQDLLNPSGTSLPVRWKRDRGFYVENLFVVECEVLDDCLAVLEEGLRNRAVGAHALNERSSRSHSILTIHIESEEDTGIFDGSATAAAGDAQPSQRFGKISFVDLAGSERVKESKTVGDALTETFNINKSLLVLGTCISALSDAKKKGGHVPYRDSKLTKLLMDSLGGSGLALMIACVSPSESVVSETIQTLRYASRAKRIRNKPVVNLDPKEQLIAKLKNEVKLLRNENSSLKMMLQKGGGGGGGGGGSGGGSNANPNPNPNFRAISAAGSASLVQLAANNPYLGQDPQFLAQLAQSYAMELDSVKYENTQLSQAKQRTEQMYGSLMRENEVLRAQLEQYGHPFGEGIIQPAKAANATTAANASRVLNPAVPRNKGRPAPEERQAPPGADKFSKLPALPTKVTNGTVRKEPPQPTGASSPTRIPGPAAPQPMKKSPTVSTAPAQDRVGPGGAPQLKSAPVGASLPLGIDLNALRADVSRLDEEIARYSQ